MSATLAPSSGPVLGGTRVHLAGDAYGTTVLGCEFDSQGLVQVEDRRKAGSPLPCISPASDSDRTAMVDVYVEGGGTRVARFQYYVQPVVLAISPSSGRSHGGVLTTVVGVGFAGLDGFSCRFAGSSGSPLLMVAREGRYVSSSLVVCVTPAGSPGTLLTVGVSNNGVDTSSGSSSFLLHGSAAISSVYPSEYPVGRQSMATVLGSGFIPSLSLSCRLGGAVSPGTWVSSSQLTCDLACTTSGNKTMEVSNYGLDFTQDVIRVECFSLPSVMALLPQSGPVQGGTRVAVLLKGTLSKKSRVSVRFGTGRRAAECMYAGVARVLCLTPDSAGPGRVVVTLAVDGTPLPSEQLSYFLYTLPCMIERLAPCFGPVQGGIALSVYGQDFSSSRTWCKFGGYSLREGAVMSSTMMICMVPAGEAGIVQLTASTNGVDFALPGSSFTFLGGQEQRQQRIETIIPSVLVVGKQQLITVLGTAFGLFTGELTCRFGSLPDRFQARQMSSSLILCMSVTSYAPGNSSVHVSLDGADLATSPLDVTWIPGIVILAVSPSILPSSGGGVLVAAASLSRTARVQCLFGNGSSQCQHVNDSSVSCQLPPHPTGKASLQLSTDGTDGSASAPVWIDVVASPMLVSIIPSIGPSSSRSVVTVLGVNLVDGGIQCRFGEVYVSNGQWISSTLIECNVPLPQTEGVVSLAVSANDVNLASVERLRYASHRPLLVWSILPAKAR